MSENAARKGVTDAKPDWERIAADYRAGMFSIREIAKLNNLSEGAIRKKAKRAGWKRDLTEKIRESVRSKLVRAVRSEGAPIDVRTATPPLTDEQIIREAAWTVVEAIRSHRRYLSGVWRIANALSSQLQEAVDHRDEIEQDIAALTASDKTADRYLRMMRSVSMPSHMIGLKDLSLAMKNIVAMERKAFGMSDHDDGAPPSRSDKDERKEERDRNSSLLSRLRECTQARVVAA